VGPAARAAWAAIWRSPAAAALDARADREALVDYIALVDERERLRARMAASGQLDRVLVQRLGAVEGRIDRLREALGLTPRARARLGLEAALARKAMTEARRGRARPQPAAPADDVPDDEVVDLDSQDA
jgi:hypothetical protein